MDQSALELVRKKLGPEVVAIPDVFQLLEATQHRSDWNVGDLLVHVAITVAHRLREAEAKLVVVPGQGTACLRCKQVAYFWPDSSVRVLTCCNCANCAPFRGEVALIKQTEREDLWLCPRPEMGNPHSLLRLKLPDGRDTVCCFKACAVELLPSSGYRP